MIIRLRDIQCYAYHGVLEEEKQKGNTFLVDVSITVDDPQGMPSDDIQDTLDYRCVCAIVQKEMQQPSDLLEHVAEQSSVTERRAEEVERETIKLKKAEYIIAHNPKVAIDLTRYYFVPKERITLRQTPEQQR